MFPNFGENSDRECKLFLKGIICPYFFKVLKARLLLSSLIQSKANRYVNLRLQIVRVTFTLKLFIEGGIWRMERMMNPLLKMITFVTLSPLLVFFRRNVNFSRIGFHNHSWFITISALNFSVLYKCVAFLCVFFCCFPKDIWSRYRFYLFYDLFFFSTSITVVWHINIIQNYYSR